MLMTLRVYIAAMRHFGIRNTFDAIAEARRRSKAETRNAHAKAFNTTFNRFSVVQ